MVLLRAVRRIETGSLQTEQQPCASVEDAIRAAVLKVGMGGEYEDLCIVEDDEVLLDREAVLKACDESEFHPESLVVAAHRSLVKNPRFAELGIEKVWLFPGTDGLTMNVVSDDGPMFTGTLKAPGWQERYRDKPEALAQVLLQGLPVRGSAVKRTITDKRYLFLRTLEDLEQRVASNDEYSMLGIAGLLRLLIWDGNPLAYQINTEFKRKITFQVNRCIKPRLMKDQPKGGRLRLVRNGLQFQAVEEAFYPHHEAGTAYTKDQFFKLPVLQVDEHVFTVLELMKHLAYVGGTIHALDPGEEGDRALHDFRGLMQVQGVGPGLRTLRGIGRVVLASLTPLRVDVIDQLRGEERGEVA